MRLAFGGAPVAVKPIAVKRSTKLRTSLYNVLTVILIVPYYLTLLILDG
jgi:hypothetical protein